MSKIVTIHQPDFMPWFGLFDKINNADEWIVLDHVVNNPKDAAFWCRRVKMLVGGKPDWVSVTLQKEEGKTFIPINEIKIQPSDTLFKKMAHTIKYNYSRAPHFKEIYQLIEQYIDHESNFVQQRNMSFILEVIKRLEIKTKILYSSDMNPTDSSNEMLIGLLLQRDANIYLCGSGAASYQIDELYHEKNIEIKYNQYQPQVYKQFNSMVFIPGLSIIDVLMNQGYEDTKKMLIKK